MADEIKKLPRKYIAIGIVILLLILIGVFFFARSRQAKEEETSLFPSPISITETSPTPTLTSTPTPTPTPKSTPTVTPTPKPTPTPTIQTKTLTSTASLDGFQSSNGGGNATFEIRAGRNVNLITRGFVSFDLASIPTGATIKKATLRLYQTGVTGDPYGVGGSLKVDHLDYGSSFENSDYNISSISSSFTTLTQNPAVEWKDADVTDALKNDFSNSRSRSQFRIHFAIENTGGTVSGDFAYFESADNSTGSGNTPQLVVEYY